MHHANPLINARPYEQHRSGEGELGVLGMSESLGSLVLPCSLCFEGPPPFLSEAVSWKQKGKRMQNSILWENKGRTEQNNGWRKIKYLKYVRNKNKWVEWREKVTELLDWTDQIKHSRKAILLNWSVTH